MGGLVLHRTQAQGLGRPLMGLDYTNLLTKGLVMVGSPMYCRSEFVINKTVVDMLGTSFSGDARSAYMPHSDTWKPTEQITVLVWLGEDNRGGLSSFICGCEAGGYGWGIYTFLGGLSARLQTTDSIKTAGIGAGALSMNCLGFSYDGAALRTYRGGAHINSTAQTGTILYDSTTLDINGKGGGAETANKISVPLICLWDRALSLDEIKDVTHNPMQLFEHLRTVI